MITSIELSIRFSKFNYEEEKLSLKDLIHSSLPFITGLLSLSKDRLNIKLANGYSW